jgi:hypothetical protein
VPAPFIRAPLWKKLGAGPNGVFRREQPFGEFSIFQITEFDVMCSCFVSLVALFLLCFYFKVPSSPTTKTHI